MLNIKKFLPYKTRIIINKLFNRDIKLIGNFKSWKEALKNSKGYSDKLIFNKTKKSFEKVLKGIASYERDSVAFYTDNPNKELINIISRIVKKKNKINICDFGGSLASSYFQNIKFLNKNKIVWNIVEQKSYVQYAKKKIKIKNLNFFSDLEKVLKKKIDLIIFSSVLQYLEDPYKVLGEISKKKIKHIIVLRTPFTSKSDLLKIQIIPKHIYNSSYPVRIFNFKRFIFLMKKYGYGVKQKIDTKEKLANYNYKGLHLIKN